MTLTRKNNALTNDVVSIYDYVGYAEEVGAAITNAGNQANLAGLQSGGGAPSGDGGVIGDIVGFVVVGLGKLFGWW